MATHLNSMHTLRLRSEALVKSSLATKYTVADPTTLDVTITTPSGVESTRTYPANITRDALGLFSTDVLCDAVGRWSARWAAGGAVVGEQPYEWDVVE